MGDIITLRFFDFLGIGVGGGESGTAVKAAGGTNAIPM